MITLNGADYTVVGILPPNFLFYGTDRDVYIPLGQWNDPSFRDRRVDESAHAIGRLKLGVTLAQARGDMDTIAHHLAVLYPEADKDVGISLVSMKEDMVGNVQPVLFVLLAAVGFLLLIACANVASLLLARSMARSGEFAVRSALGASRARLVRQLLTESILLAATGGLLGLALAFLATKAITAALPAELPRAADVAIDARVLLFSLGVSLLAGIVFGLAPALKTSRTNLQEVLRQAGRGAAGARHRLQGLFVAAEVALAIVLLVGAGLMLRTFAALWKVNPGYNPDHAIAFSVSLPSNAKTTAAETRARLRQFDAAMRAIPGVEAVSVTLGSRPMIHDSALPFWIEGEPKPDNDNDMHPAMFYLVESGFQRAMGMTLLRGRFISDHDDENAPTVIDIDDVLARKYFPHQNPVGQHVHLAQFDVEAEIVGVVGHVKQWGPGNDPKAAIEAQFYYPMMQLPPKLMPLVADVTAVVIRTHDDPAAIMGPVRRAIAQIDPNEIGQAQCGVGKADLFPDPAGVLCRPCADAVVYRDLRSHLVSGGRAHAGNRGAHGAGRAAFRRSSPRARSGREDGVARSRFRDRARRRTYPPDVRATLRRIAARSAHVRRRRFGIDAGSARRLLHPGATRGFGRSHGGAAGAIAVLHSGQPLVTFVPSRLANSLE